MTILVNQKYEVHEWPRLMIRWHGS